MVAATAQLTDQYCIRPSLPIFPSHDDHTEDVLHSFDMSWADATATQTSLNTAYHLSPLFPACPQTTLRRQDTKPAPLVLRQRKLWTKDAAQAAGHLTQGQTIGGSMLPCGGLDRTSHVTSRRECLSHRLGATSPADVVRGDTKNLDFKDGEKE